MIKSKFTHNVFVEKAISINVGYNLLFKNQYISFFTIQLTFYPVLIKTGSVLGENKTG